MQKNKIPIINDTFDITTFKRIFIRSFWIGIIIMIFAIGGGLLKIRYTSPVYEVKSILQIQEDNKNTQVFQLDNLYDDNKKLSKTIALIRSKEFLKRTFDKLPLKTRYYIEGAFLSTETYKNSPYTVNYEIQNSSIYGIPLHIHFENESTAIIEFEIGGKLITKEINLNNWNDLGYFSCRVDVNNFQAIKSMYEKESQNSYYFIISNIDQIYKEHSEKLTIRLLNSSSNSVEITYKSNNSLQAADVANTIAREFQAFDVEKKKESVKNILDFIETQLKSVYQTLDKTENKLQKFKKENNISNEDFGKSPFPIFTSKIEEFNEQITRLDFEIFTLENVKKQLNIEGNANTYELIAILAGTSSEKVLVNILSNLQNLINEKNQLLNDVTENNMRIKLIEKQINNQRKLIVDFVSNNLIRLKEKREEYQKKSEEYENKLFEENSFDKLEYARLQRLHAINEGFYNQLIQKKAEYMISQAGYVTQNVILEKAVDNSQSISPNKKQVLAGAIVIGVILYLILIFIRYLLFNEITSISMIKSYSKSPVIGVVPAYKKKVPVSQLLVNEKPNSMFTEAFRNIRSNLQFLSPGPGSNVITVTSTISGEGKTFIAINLAGIQAISGKKAIILDMDLRKPRLHLGFNVSNDRGMSTILINRHDYKDCIHHSAQENLDFITAGPVPPNPAELVFSKKMDELIEELEEIYDVIIIDTPPIGIVTDALVNLQRANYPIYVLKSGLSKRNFLENINSLIDDKKLDNLSSRFQFC